MPNEAVAPNYLDLYPEWQMPDEQRLAFRNTRTGAVVGQQLADRFHWKIGDKIPLQATIFPQKNGSNAWTFDLVGIYHVTDAKLKSQEEHDVLQLGLLRRGARLRQRPCRLVHPASRRSGRRRARIAQAIDALSANSDHETKTQTEQAFAHRVRRASSATSA